MQHAHKYFVLKNGKDNLGKFDAKSDEGIFFGYSLTSKVFRVFNKRSLVVEESIHVIFNESNPHFRKNSFDDDDDDDDVGILQENIDGASQEKENDQEEIKDDELTEEKLNEP